MTVRADIVIAGAGAAGLAAAVALGRSEQDILVLEARDRLGGRIHTIEPLGWPLPIELGAEFVHGRPKPTWELISAGRLLAEQLPNEHFEKLGEEYRRIPNYWEKIDALGKKIPEEGHDLSVADFLTKARFSPWEKRAYREFVEGYHGADVERASVRALSTRGEKYERRENDQFRLLGGYSQLVRQLEHGLNREQTRVELNTAVTAVKWKNRSVEIHTQSPAGTSVIHARRAIFTVPAAVLREVIDFDPPLAEKARALESIATAPVVKVVLRFADSFWEEEHGNLAFLHPGGPFPTWWTSMPAKAPMLTAWAGGPAASQLLRESEANICELAWRAAAEVFKESPKRVRRLAISASMHDWQKDQYARGAYSYLQVGGSNANRSLRRSVRDTLYFAGEATSDESGTVAGAIESGQRVAKEILRKR